MVEKALFFSLGLALVGILLLAINVAGKNKEVEKVNNRNYELKRELLEKSWFIVYFRNQENVDATLARYAKNYAEECEWQICIQAKKIGKHFEVSGTSAGMPLSSYAIKMDEVTIDKRVAYAKETFWKAHSAAKVEGYMVRESFKNYLPPNPEKKTSPGRGSGGGGGVTGWEEKPSSQNPDSTVGPICNLDG